MPTRHGSASARRSSAESNNFPRDPSTPEVFMIRLYSAFYCPFALRTRFVLKEKGLAYEHTEIDPKNKPADFHTISPYGKVPVLLDDETRVYESAIINEYLDEAYPAPPLMPKEPARRAYVRIWIDFANSRLAP